MKVGSHRGPNIRRSGPPSWRNAALLTNSILLLGWCAISFALLPWPPSAAGRSPLHSLQGEIGALELGKPVERELAGGQTHVYRLPLSAGQYLRVVVAQKGVDVAAGLFGLDETKLAEVSLPRTLQEPKVIMAVIDLSGNHRLEVRSQNKEAAAGRYEVQIAELREATPRDRSLIAGKRAVEMGASLREQRTAEALRESIKKFEQAIPFFREAADSNAEADALVDIAGVYYRLSDFRSSLDCYNRALALYRAGNNRGGEAAALNGIGSAHTGLGDSQKAIDFRNQALRLFRAENNRSGEASALNGIGYAYSTSSDYQKMLETLNEALPLHRTLGNRGGEADAIHLIGLAYSYQGKFLKALEFYDQALALYRAAGHRRSEGPVTHSIALAYYHLGDHQKALDSYGEALSIHRAVGNRRGEANSLGGMGQVYWVLGENQKALDYLDQALSVFRSAGARHNESIQLTISAQVYVSMGDYQKALDLFTQSLQICRLIGDRSGEAYNTNGIGVAHAGLHEYRKTFDSHSHALALFRAIGHRRGEADTLSHIGRAHLSLGEHQKAAGYLNDALAIYRALRIRRGEAQTLFAIARAHQARGYLLEARSQSEAAIHLAETFRHDVANLQLRTSYLATVRDYYELNIDLLMQLHKQRPSDGLEAVALETSERARARSLLDLLGEAGVDTRQGVEPALLEQERSLRHLINAQAERQTQQLSGKLTPEQVAALAREIEATIAEYQDVQAKIRAASPRYAALTQPEPLSLKQIQEQVLDTETLLLEYAIGDKRSYLWAVTQTTLTGHELPGRAEIEAAARRFYDLAKDNTKGEALAQSAARLSQMLLAPVADRLGTNRLAIVPDGALQYVPFGALPKPVASRQSSVVGGLSSVAMDNGPQTTDRPPLILEHEIVSLPSASTLAVLRREIKGRATAPKLVAVLADPVFDVNDVRLRRPARDVTDKETPTDPGVNSKLVRSVKETGLANGEWPLPRLLGTRREAAAILALAPESKRRQALDFEANREAVTGGEIGEYQIVHFATHGVLNSHHPELSGIVLSLIDGQGRPRDGFLRLHEIYNLRLPAELVVLSACQTGLGKEIRGEGLVGLTRGFMYAGAPRLVTSLWQVDDKATSELMKLFYRGMLGQKLTAAAALRAAQVEMWRQKDWPSPYYWAAFALQGEWR